MADELTITRGLRFTKSNLQIEHAPNTSNVTVSGDAISHTVQSIPTTAAGTALVVAAAVSTLGWARFRNVDATNYIEVGVQHSGTTFMPFVRCNINEPASEVRLAQGITLFARANTGAALLEIEIIED